MELIEIILPQMGEGIIEAKILNWVKKEGEKVNEEEIIVEVATDKVDTEISSPYAGTIKQILINIGEMAKIGEPIAMIETKQKATETKKTTTIASNDLPSAPTTQHATEPKVYDNDQKKFYSPLVRNIAKKENISIEALNAIGGTGLNSRVTKYDILSYIKNKKTGAVQNKKLYSNDGDEITEMSRIRKIIAQKMVLSKQTAPHVNSFTDADVTNTVMWREKNKHSFLEKTGHKITFMPIIVQAVAKALEDFPIVNSILDGTTIITKKQINIGIAVALSDGNLIVPVIKNANKLNLIELSKSVNTLAKKAKNNTLSSNEITGGTYTLSNIGITGNTIGTPIILQPQVGIIACGAIRKKPVVLDSPHGDVIAIRSILTLCHSYDHRIIDGALGGFFVQRVKKYLEDFNKADNNITY